MTQAARATATRPATSESTPARILIMLGAPGAGKGTQAQRLATRLGVPHVSTGDLFRAARRADSALGAAVRPYLERGLLVPDDLTIQVITDRLSRPDARAGVILDGFPRTRPQAEALDRLASGRGWRVAGALYIEVDAEELVRRLSGRRVCTGPGAHVYHLLWNPPARDGVCDIDRTPLEQRSDDRPETIRSRLDRQMPPMFEVVDHYTEAGILTAVRGDRPIEEITNELARVVDLTEKRP
jgi:adenylate kinase